MKRLFYLLSIFSLFTSLQSVSAADRCEGNSWNSHNPCKQLTSREHCHEQLGCSWSIDFSLKPAMQYHFEVTYDGKNYIGNYLLSCRGLQDIMSKSWSKFKCYYLKPNDNSSSFTGYWNGTSFSMEQYHDRRHENCCGYIYENNLTGDRHGHFIRGRWKDKFGASGRFTIRLH